jgi:hypothetical protein
MRCLLRRKAGHGRSKVREQRGICAYEFSRSVVGVQAPRAVGSRHTPLSLGLLGTDLILGAWDATNSAKSRPFSSSLATNKLLSPHLLELVLN